MSAIDPNSYSMSMHEELKEVEVKTDTDENLDMDIDDATIEDDETSATSASASTADALRPLQKQLTQIDQHYPPPARPTHPESFHSVGQKRQRLYESESTAAKSVQTAASLYRDALHSIYQFLNLKEFVRTCVISKTYYLAGQQMRSRNELLFYKRPIFLLVQSPLRHHITKLHIQLLDPSNLLPLQCFMGHLEDLSISNILTKDYLVKYSSNLSFAIPKQLKSLDIWIRFWDGCNLTTEVDARTYLCECMKQIAAQSTRLTTLSVFLPRCSGVIDCPHEILRTLTTVTDLRLPNQIDLNQQIDLVKSLPSLRVWTRSNELSIETIQRLADGPSPSRLEDIGTLESEDVNELFAEQLKRLVTLTKLDITSLRLSDPTRLLPHFPRLSSLILGCHDTVDRNHLVTALSGCVSLTELDLQHTELTSLNIGQFLPHLSSLVKLTFSRCEGLVSLEFLTTASASLGHLTHFTIRESTQMPLNEYDHLRAISQSLESLAIYHSFVDRIDPLTIIGRWTPGSKEFKRQEWPKLKSFRLRQ